MPLSEKAFNVLTRPLPKEVIKKRPGKAGMEFSYIAPDFVIDTLNEAFEYRWNTEIVHQAFYPEERVVVVGLRLTVYDTENNFIQKEQFGSCEVTRGLALGEAFKGAASDAMKKCATLLGIGLELYRDDEVPAGLPSAPSFTPPRAPVAPPRPVAPPTARPPAPPARPSASVAAPPSRPPAPPAPVRKDNPFAGNGVAASVPKPAPPVTKAPAAVPAPPKANPFAAAAGAGTGPNPTQLNALTNLAQRRGLDAAGLIGLAGVTDAVGNPVQTFEDLTREQAIQVIRAAQQ